MERQALGRLVVRAVYREVSHHLKPASEDSLPLPGHFGLDHACSCDFYDDLQSVSPGLLPNHKQEVSLGALQGSGTSTMH